MTENETLSALHFLLGYEKAVDEGKIEGNSFLNSQEKEALEFILEEIQQYRAIGTVEEFKVLKEKNETLKALYEDARKEGNNLLERARNKAIDEAIETSAKAICIGCGYLDGYKCNYKCANCGVSKPMLESVVKALEQMKGGAE